MAKRHKRTYGIKPFSTELSKKVAKDAYQALKLEGKLYHFKESFEPLTGLDSTEEAEILYNFINVSFLNVGYNIYHVKPHLRETSTCDFIKELKVLNGMVIQKYDNKDSHIGFWEVINIYIRHVLDRYKKCYSSFQFAFFFATLFGILEYLMLVGIASLIDLKYGFVISLVLSIIFTTSTIYFNKSYASLHKNQYLV